MPVLIALILILLGVIAAGGYLVYRSGNNAVEEKPAQDAEVKETEKPQKTIAVSGAMPAGSALFSKEESSEEGQIQNAPQITVWALEIQIETGEEFNPADFVTSVSDAEDGALGISDKLVRGSYTVTSNVNPDQ